MAFPTAETLGQPDPRFLDLVRIIDGRASPMEFADQYEAMVTLELSANTPQEVRASFDRGRSIFLFAWYDYEQIGRATSEIPYLIRILYAVFLLKKKNRKQ